MKTPIQQQSGKKDQQGATRRSYLLHDELIRQWLDTLYPGRRKAKPRSSAAQRLRAFVLRVGRSLRQWFKRDSHPGMAPGISTDSGKYWQRSENTKQVVV